MRRTLILLDVVAALAVVVGYWFLEYRASAEEHPVYTDSALAQDAASAQFFGQSSPARAEALAVIPVDTGSIASEERLQAALELLADAPDGAALVRTLSAAGAKVVFGNAFSIAGFSPMAMEIAVNPSYRNADTKAIAAVLAHETSHLSDFQNGEDVYSRAGCYDTEIKAFATEAKVWQSFYGPTGKAPAPDALDVELNSILTQYDRGPDAFRQTVMASYGGKCGG